MRTAFSVFLLHCYLGAGDEVLIGKGEDDSALLLQMLPLPAAWGRVSGAARFPPGTSQQKGEMNEVGIAVFLRSGSCR